MLQRCCRRRPPPRRPQQLPHKQAGQRAAVRPVAAVGPVAQETPSQAQSTGVRRRAAHQEGVGYGAEAPNVGISTRGPLRAVKQLWRCVGALRRCDGSSVGVQDGREAQVADLHGGVGQLRGQPKAARAQVTVVDLLRMAVRQGDQHLADILDHGGLMKPVALLGDPDHPFGHIAASAFVHDDIDVVLVLENLLDTADVRMAELAKHLQPWDCIRRYRQSSTPLPEAGLGHGLADLRGPRLALSQDLHRAEAPQAHVILKHVLGIKDRAAGVHSRGAEPGGSVGEAGNGGEQWAADP
mmetsp:Transcript_90787/g.271014  ORF Transcript_90787/g.271014 Transcript_90787/m.271014 type:complete len:297 (+) Transcript_90787:917-1807(+)